MRAVFFFRRAPSEDLQLFAAIPTLAGIADFITDYVHQKNLLV